MRTCLFCDNDADSKEHVISKRLATRMGIPTENITVASLTESGGFQARTPYPLISFETRRVCTSCNNGWMNDLESFMETGFASLLEPCWPPKGKARITQPDHLLRWMAKTASIVQEAGLLKKTVMDADMTKQVPSLVKTDDVHLFAAFIRQGNLDVRLEKGFRTWEHGTLHPNREHRHGYSFTVQMNHIALRLLVAPAAEPCFVMPYLPHRKTYPIPISENIDIVHAPQHTYETMLDFYSCIEIHL